jgi:hypothetical protein
MNSDPDSQATDPSGLLTQRVGNHVASAERLIQQSHQLIARIRDRMQQTDRRGERTIHWVRDAAGVERVAERFATGAEERYLRAKQRELAAHERAIQRHDEAAELQQHLGRPDRAAEAEARLRTTATCSPRHEPSWPRLRPTPLRTPRPSSGCVSSRWSSPSPTAGSALAE